MKALIGGLKELLERTQSPEHRSTATNLVETVRLRREELSGRP